MSFKPSFPTDNLLENVYPNQKPLESSYIHSKPIKNYPTIVGPKSFSLHKRPLHYILSFEEFPIVFQPLKVSESCFIRGQQRKALFWWTTSKTSLSKSELWRIEIVKPKKRKPESSSIHCRPLKNNPTIVDPKSFSFHKKTSERSCVYIEYWKLFSPLRTQKISFISRKNLCTHRQPLKAFLCTKDLWSIFYL